MRLIHTSDWHLGHRLHDVSREREHREFLDWLLDRIEEHAVDALLVAGDVFDVANPSARAQALWYDFLADASRRFEGLEIVVIGGNHDSAARLDAPDPILRALDVRVVGGMPQRAGAPAPAATVIPLHDRRGTPAARVAAVPFLRPADLPRVEGDGDPLVEGVRAIYADAIAEAREQAGDDLPVVAMGHCYMTGTALSDLSERKILGGNQHALPVDIFPDDVAYVALGHLHRAQAVGRETVRYSGSPIPLSLAERDYPHQVVLVDLAGPGAADVRPLRVPRSVEILRVPERGHAPLEEVLPRLQALDLPSRNGDAAPFLEVGVRLEQPEPTLRRRIEEALEGKHVTLARIVPSYTGDRESLSQREPDGRGLKDMSVEEVFRHRWRRDHDDEPPEDLLEALHELIDQVEQEGAR
ncbi:MAG: exonuclease SbcCD subunit D C-terminal domain-containing protein [Myxococcota bacterium]